MAESAGPHPHPLPQAGEGGASTPPPVRGGGDGRAPASLLVRLCHADELVEGTARGFDPGGEGRDTIFVVRRAGLHAWRNSCPHWPGTPMAWRKDAYLSGDGQSIVCSAHGARFAIDSGQCTVGPCVGESLTPVPLMVGEDGGLCVAPQPQPGK